MIRREVYLLLTVPPSHPPTRLDFLPTWFSRLCPVPPRIYFAGGNVHSSALRDRIHPTITSASLPTSLLDTLKSGLVPHSAAPEPCRSEQLYPPPSPPRRTTSRRGSKRRGIILPIPPRAPDWVLGCPASRVYHRTGPLRRATLLPRRMVRGCD